MAHRGLSEQYPENTSRAFRAAYDAGADGVELDVHISRDGVPVVIHDHWLDRTCAGASRQRVDFTDFRDLSEISAHYPDKFGSDFYPQSILSLRQFSILFANKTGPVFIELKPQTIEPRHVARILEDSAVLGDRRVFISFDAALLRAVRNLPTGLCLNRYEKHPRGFELYGCAAVTCPADRLEGSWFIWGTNDAAGWLRKGAKFVCVNSM